MTNTTKYCVPAQPCPGLPTHEEISSSAPRPPITQDKNTITLTLDVTTARQLRALARSERRTEEAQALYILEIASSALYIGYTPKFFISPRTANAPEAIQGENV